MVIWTTISHFRARKWTFHDECAFGALILIDFILRNLTKMKKILKSRGQISQNFLGAFGAEGKTDVFFCPKLTFLIFSHCEKKSVRMARTRINVGRPYYTTLSVASCDC